MLQGRTSKIPIYLVHGVLIALFVIPLLWSLSTSLKTPREIMVYPPVLVPTNPTIEHYVEIWTARDGIFRRYFVNSVIVTVVGMAFSLSIMTMGAYALSKRYLVARPALTDSCSRKTMSSYGTN